MNNDFSRDNLTKDAQEFLKQNNIDPKKMNSNAAQKLLSGLNKSDSEKINKILNDKTELEKLLSSEKAKQIMKHLFGDGAK